MKLNKKGKVSQNEKKINEIPGDRNLFWKNNVEKLPAIYLSVYLYVCVHVLFCLIVNKMHFQTPVSFLCATFRPSKYFQNFS